MKDLPEIKVRRPAWVRAIVSFLAAALAFGTVYHFRRPLKSWWNRSFKPAAVGALAGARASLERRAPRLAKALAAVAPLPTQVELERRWSKPPVLRGAPRAGSSRDDGQPMDLRQHMDAPVLLPEVVREETKVERLSAFAMMMFAGIACFFGLLAYVLLGVNDPHNKAT